MTTTRLIELCKQATVTARALRKVLLEIAAELGDPDAHAHSAALYGAISELRETLRPATMMLAERQAALFQASRGSRRDFKQAHIDGAERARLSMAQAVQP